MAACYRQLANYHARRGASSKATLLARKAAWHYAKGGYDDPPAAVAMAMPVPRPEPEDLVSTRDTEPDDVA